MAFQAGTQIRPELGNADFSGFARAAEIQGQAFANLGAQIGGAIKDYNEKKEEKKLTGQAAELLAGLPGAEGLGITDKETARVAINSLGGPAATLQALNAFQMGQANLESTRQATDQAAEAFPLQQQVTQAQLNGMTAGAVMAERKQKLSEDIAKNTREQNERKLNLEEQELNLKIAQLASQGNSVSVKQVQSAQEFLEDNDLMILDGAVYEKSGMFGGKLTEVLNPAILDVEGVKTLLDMSANAGAVSPAASENFEGMRIVPEGEGGQPVVSESAVSEAALDSVVQPRPEGSRLERGADSIMRSLGNFREAGLEFGKGTKALPFAAFDYLVNPDSPSFDVSKARARGLTTPLFQ